MERSLIMGYNTLLKGDKKIPVDDSDKTKDKGVPKLKFINKIAYNKLIITQEYTVCFQIFGESNTKANSYKTQDKRG